MINNKIYVEFPKGKQTEFLRKVKSRVPLTWVNMARILKVNRSMIYFYLNENSRMAHSSYVELCKIANLNLDDCSYKISNFKLRGTAKTPNELTPKLAEFVGMLLGDGSITSFKNQICISMDAVLDKKYINEITKTYFIDLFGKEPLIYQSKRSRNIRCLIYSREICTYLTLVLNLPKGERKYSIKNIIPEVFFKDKELLKAVIRGLFDTEGGFYQHNKTSPRLYIYNTSKYLLKSIHRALIELGYNAIMKKRWVKICRKEDIVKFFKEIGTNNEQKRLKYEIWLKEGKVPSTAKILEMLHGCGAVANIRASQA